MNAQGIAPLREAKLVLLGDPYVRQTVEMFGTIPLAIVGLGPMEPSGMLARISNIFSALEIADVVDAGGVGDMSLRFLDAEGRHVETPLDERVIGVPLEEHAKVDRSIGLAGGKSKTAKVRGALHTGVLDLLITDKFTEERLVSPTDQNN